MAHKKLDWRIRFKGRIYRIQQWGGTYVIEIAHDHNFVKTSKLSKDKQLRKLVEMWGHSSYQMKLGVFINKITGLKCDDLI